MSFFIGGNCDCIDKTAKSVLLTYRPSPILRAFRTLLAKQG